MAIEEAATPRTPIDLILSAGSAIGLSDSELVEALIRGRDDGRELAFRALLDRHGSMVWGVCRQILRDAHDADDAFQATFLVLIRRARSLRISESLGPWLYQVAWRVALQTRSSRARVRATLSDQLDQAEQPVPHRRIDEDAFIALHGELNHLPSKYRMPIVLCYLEGKTHEEAARTLRCPVGTLSGRLSRGRALLRSRLERRGWRSPEDLAALSISACRVPIGHSGLLDIKTKTANGLLSQASTAPSINIIARGVMRTMFWNRFKCGVACLVLFGSLAGTTIMLVLSSSAASLSSGSSGRAHDRGPAGSSLTVTPVSQPGPPLELAVADPQDRAGARSGANRRRQGSDSSDEITLDNAPPVVVKTSPEAGAADVDPSLDQIRVTFSKKMLDKSWSWSTASENTFPKVTGEIQYLADGRTCVLPVKLEPGKTYATWINSGRFINFKDRDRRPAVPYLLVFQTKR